jgi:hypothetical protein
MLTDLIDRLKDHSAVIAQLSWEVSEMSDEKLISTYQLFVWAIESVHAKKKEALMASMQDHQTYLQQLHAQEQAEQAQESPDALLQEL